MKSNNPKSFLDYETFTGSQCGIHFITSAHVHMHSLIKMLYWMIKKTNQPLTRTQLEHAVRRNFGGLDEVDAVGIFLKNIPIAAVNLDVPDPKVLSIV